MQKQVVLQEKIAEIVSLYESGILQKDIASSMNTDQSTISRLLSGNGYECRLGGKKRKYAAQLEDIKGRINEITMLYESGVSQTEIAELLGVRRVTVHRAFVDMGYTYRIPHTTRARGARHPLWKGDDAGYAAFHERVRSYRGTPKTCEVCGDTKERKYEWANLTGNYQDIYDYKRMCTPCHRKYDYSRK